MSNAIKVLFVCVHNSARSQMAEAYLKKFGGDRFVAESAGLEPGEINPFVVKVLAEDGIDISCNTSKSVFHLFKEGRIFQFVISVCDEASGQKCPIFPGLTNRLHWSFDDPSSFIGTDEEKLQRTREIRDAIKARILQFISEIDG